MVPRRPAWWLAGAALLLLAPAGAAAAGGTVNPGGSAYGHFLAVSVFGDAHCIPFGDIPFTYEGEFSCVAVSAFGDAEGRGVALSGAGDATSRHHCAGAQLAVGLGPTFCSGGVAVAAVGRAEGFVAITIGGESVAGAGEVEVALVNTGYGSDLPGLAVTLDGQTSCSDPFEGCAQLDLGEGALALPPL